MPCVSFTPNVTSCGIVTIKSRSDSGKLDAAGEGGEFPAASLTRDPALMINPFVRSAAAGATGTGSPTIARPAASGATPSPNSAGATPAPSVTSSFKVKLSLTLPMALADFNSSVKQRLQEVLAVASGLTKADANRVELTARAARRRLLASSMALDVVVNMPDEATAKAATAALTKDTINSGLAAAGLPPATITSAAAMSSRAAALRPPALWTAAALLLAAAVASA